MRKNAKLNRIALRGLLAALALGGLQVAHAGYTSLPPPPGYTPGTAAARATYAAAATDKAVQNLIRQAGGATATVAGNRVKINMAYKLAPNAARVAAAAIYLHPGVRTAAGIAAWLGASALFYNATKGVWEAPQEGVEPSTGILYRTRGRTAWYTTKQAACEAAHAIVASANYDRSPGAVYETSPGCKFYFMVKTGPQATPFKSYVDTYYETKQDTCPAGSYSTPAGCSPVAPPRELTEEEFIDHITGKPMPAPVPIELPPGTPLPIDRPIVNPDETDDPSGLPFRIPTGSPSPIPNTNPQRYRQPYVDIVPSPTPDDPLRVDVKPGESTSTDPKPVENPKPDAEGKPAEEQEKSLCEKHPDILACQKPDLDTPDGEIPRTSKTVTYAEEGGFGGGSCPGNLYSNIGGKSVMVYNWSETCGVVSTYLRPIILLLGAMGALFILIPGRDS